MAARRRHRQMGMGTDMRAKTRAEHISDAAWAHTNLCIFATVVGIMESGNIKAESHAAAQRIIDIAQNEQAKLLARYDRAVAAASK